MGLQVPRLVASYQANFVNGALYFMMCAIASGAAPVCCLLTHCALVHLHMIHADGLCRCWPSSFVVCP